MVRRDFADQREAEHMALIASLHEAAAWCADPANRQQLASMLHNVAFPTLTPKLLLRSLSGEDAPIFHGPNLHRPDPKKASWLVEEMHRHGLLSAATVMDANPFEAFRPDLYDRALGNNTQPTSLAL